MNIVKKVKNKYKVKDNNTNTKTNTRMTRTSSRNGIVSNRCRSDIVTILPDLEISVVRLRQGPKHLHENKKTVIF